MNFPLAARLCVVTMFACFAWQARAASLDAYAFVVGGVPTSSSAQGCGSYGPPVELSGFFTFSPPSVPQGGIGPCGYGGGMSQVTAATGPLTNSNSVGPVLLGNPGYTGSFDGTANAVANYRTLGASANANISGGIPGSPLALFQSIGAARFSDTLTATSPLFANSSAGFVRYRFSVDGSMSASGAPAAYFFGETFAVLDRKRRGL